MKKPFKPSASASLSSLLAPEIRETICRALCFHLDYCQDMMAELEEMEIVDATWAEAAQRDRRALDALGCSYDDPPLSVSTLE